MTCTVGLAIKALANQIKRSMDNTVTNDEGQALTGTQFAVIGYIGDRSDRRDVFQKDIESEFNIRRSTATGILQLMEKNDLLVREPVSRDGRLKKLILTKKADIMYQNASAAITMLEQTITKGLSQEELEAFFAIIEKMTRNLDATKKRHSPEGEAII